MKWRDYSFHVEDACGNVDNETRRVTRTFDQTVPQILDQADITLTGCNGDWPTLTTTWTDNCSAGGNVTGIPGEVQSSENGCLQWRDYSFHVEDACGNVDNETRRVTRTFDQTVPQILDQADITLTGCNGDWPTLTTTWTDNCSAGGNLTGIPGEVQSSENGCLQWRDYSFHVEDACGNVDNETRRVTRTFDQTVPQILDQADITLTGCNGDWPTLTTTWTDNCSAGGNVTGIPGEVQSSENGCLQWRDYSFHVEDACGNVDNETRRVTRTFDQTV